MYVCSVLNCCVDYKFRRFEYLLYKEKQLASVQYVMYGVSNSPIQCKCTAFQIVLAHSEHPPIMKGTSWTLAAPFKEQKYHRTPSESIANNFTPTASGLKIRNLPKRRLTASPRSK